MFLAGVRLGAIVVPVNFRLVADEVAYALAGSGAVALVTEPRWRSWRPRPRAGARRPCGPGDRRRDAGHDSEDYDVGSWHAAAPEPLDVVVDEEVAGLHHVHLRHDRAAQGRGAHPPEPADATCFSRGRRHQRLARPARPGRLLRRTAVPHRRRWRDLLSPTC